MAEETERERELKVFLRFGHCISANLAIGLNGALVTGRSTEALSPNRRNEIVEHAYCQSALGAQEKPLSHVSDEKA